jgi:SAM-dependent methyltransferase
MRGLDLDRLKAKIGQWVDAKAGRRTRAATHTRQLRLEAEPWTIDNLIVDDGSLRISGWALPPPAEPQQARFLWNDRRFDAQDYPIERPDLGEFFAQRQGAKRSGFLCSASGLASNDWFEEGCLHLRFDFDGRSPRHIFQHDWFYPDNRGYPPLPDPGRMQRVIGTDSTTQFLLGGFSDFNKFRLLLSAMSAGDITAGKRVLDWGVGCGRVGRYFAGAPDAEFFGVDIDADNVAWCGRNLRGHFQQVPLRPPVRMDAESFDVIYGISVLTHLRETDQHAWLAELHRLSAPGAILLLTFHGTTAANYAGLSPRWLDDYLDGIERKGFVVTGDNDQIEDFIDEPGYYVNVAHSKDYVRRVWGQYFEVVDLIPGMIATHDLAVLRKR